MPFVCLRFENSLIKIFLRRFIFAIQHDADTVLCDFGMHPADTRNLKVKHLMDRFGFAIEQNILHNGIDCANRQRVIRTCLVIGPRHVMLE